MPKAPAFRLHPITALIQATLMGLPVAVGAGPEGGVVAAGTGTIARPDAQTTNIQQSSQNLILNWDSYNIRANETVNYRQPNASAQALNRIHSQNPSHIYGRLNANGKVLLVNPNGVFFKPGARVNVGGLMASGLNITDQDFLAGKYRFKHAGDTPPGAVVNQGVIQAATGGSVSLLGGAVRNEGQILAHAGQVNLVAGKAMTMDFDGDGLMRFTVSEALLKKAEGLEQAVSNTGTIAAEGGAVLLQGRAARDVFSEVVNNSGVIGAARVDNKGGVIRLLAAGRGNSLINTGTLQAAGGAIKLKAEGKVEVSGKARISTASKTGRGGQIQITGNKVGLLGEAQLDASGATGGGQILAGGDYQGQNPAIKNAKVTYIGKDAKLAADATKQGKGGRVIVWADDTTRYHGAISARGGKAGGDGGFVEVSGKRHLAFRGKVSVSAAKGRAGTLLLDPKDLCIGGNTSCGSATTPEDKNDDNNNIFDEAGSDNSWVSEATLKRIGNADIILQADNSIYFDGNINLGASYTSDFRLLAGSSIDMQGKSLTLRNGTARFYAGSTVVGTSGEFTTTIERSGNITLGPVTAKTLYLSAGNVNAEGRLTVTNLRLNEDRPARTGSTGIFAKSRGYTGQYTITTAGLSNAITKLYVGGTLGDKLHLITLEGYEIASAIKTGAKTTLTFELRGADHDHAKGESEGGGDHHDDEFTITQAEGAVISGPGKLVKGGTGTLELSQANTYSGDTEVSGGTLRITHADGLGTPAEKEGKTPASKTTLTSTGSTLELDGHAGKLEINASESLILNGGRLRNESGNNTWHGPVTLGKASAIDSEAGALTINSALSLQSGKAAALKAEDLQITGAGEVRLTGVISGKGGIIKGRAGTAGAGDTGTLTLAGNNTYTGRTIVHRGVLRIQHNNALGRGAGSLGTTVNAGGVLELYATGTASLNIGNEALTLAGGTLKNALGNNTWNGNITLTANATIDSRTRIVKVRVGDKDIDIHYQQTLTLAGNISGAHNLTFTGGGHTDMRGQIQTGAGGLTKTGAGMLTLNNSNTYTGDTTVRGGTLALGGTRTNALDPSGDLIVENTTLNNNGTPDDPRDDTVLPAVFALGQANQTFANVTLRSGQITRTPGAPATRGVLTVSNTGQIQAQSGAISANLAGAAPLTKTTAGRLTLSGDNRGYTGAVTITAGILRLFGGHALDDEAAVSLSNALTNNTARLEIATSQTLGALTGRGEVYIGAGQTLTLNIGAGESASYAGVISGAASLTRTLFRGGRLVTETIRGGLTKTGAGRLTLKGANTFGGQTRINQGKLRIEHLLALQNTAVHLADAANTQLTVATASLSKERTRIGSLSGGAAADATGEARDHGKIVIFKGQVLAINQTTDGTYSGRITQVTPDPLPQIFIDEPRLPRPSAADLIKTGAGKLTLSGENTYTGLTLINEGTLAIGQDNAINAASALIVGQAPRFDFARVRLIDPVPGVFDLGAHNQTLSRVQLNAGAINRTGATGSNQGVLTVNSLIGEHGPLIGFTLMSGTVNAILAGRTSLLKDNPFVSLIINRYSYALYIESGVTLNAANTYSGKTTISKGTLRITDAGALGTAANDDATGTTIESGGFLRFCLRRVECGVSRRGGGTLELALGDGNHSIDNETLILAGQGAFDTKNLDITRETVAQHIVGAFDAKGALRNVSGNNTWGGAVELESDATIQNDSGDSAAAAPSLTLSGDLSLDHDEEERADLTVTGPGRTLLSGRIRGLGGLIKQGTGWLVLQNSTSTAANDYAGGTKIKAGVLELQGGYAIPDDGALNKGVTLSKNATLRVSAGETLGSLRDDPADKEDPGGKVEIVKGQTLTLNNAAGNDTTYSGVISEVDPDSGVATGRANLTKQGAGKFTLRGLNTYTGETTIEAGTLALGVNDALPASARLTVGTDAASPAAATLDLGAFDATVGNLILQSGRITGTGALKVDSAGKFDLRRGTVSAVLDGTADLEKNQVSATIAGAVTLSGANTYTGQTNINAGDFILMGANNVIPDSSAVTLNNAATGNTARLIVRKDETLGSLSGGSGAGGGIDIEKGRTLTVNQTGETTYNGVIREINPLSGVSMQRAALTKRGLGRLTLGGANLYTGLTTIAEGILAIASNQALGTGDRGTVVNPGATLALAPASGNLNIANEALTLSGQGVNAGTAGAPDYLGALRNVRGNNTWSGAVTLAGDATIRSDAGSLRLSAAPDLQTAGGAAASLTVTGAGDTVLSGQISGSGGLIKRGAGALVLSNNDSANPTDYTGGTELAAGTLDLRGGHASPDNGAAGQGITLAGDATLRVTNSETLGSLAGSGNVHIVKGRTLTVNNASGNDTTYAGVISEVDPASGAATGRANLTKQSAGKFMLAGLNTYTGETKIEDGALKLGVAGAINAGGRLLVSGADAVFDLAGFNNTFAGVELEDGRIDDSGRGADGATKGVLTLSTGDYDLQDGTVNAVLAGGSGVGLQKNAVDAATPGTVILTAANTYSGQTTVNAGTLSITHKDALGDTTGRTTVASGGTLALALSGTNALGEALTLAGAGAAATGGGTLGALRNTSGANTLSGSITLRGDTTIYSVGGSGNSLTLGGAISGAFGLTKTGAGRLTLTGANTFSGQTRIDQGDLRIEHLLALQNSAVHIADAANTQLTVATKSLPWSRERLTRIGSLSGGAAPGATGAARDNGRIVIFRGQVLAINQTTDGVFSGRIMEQDAVPLPAIFRQFPFLKPRSAVLIKTGAARLTLSGKNTYTGFTIINQGTLAIGQDDAIHAASSLIVGQPPGFNAARGRLIDPVEGVFDLGTYNQTLSGVELNAGAINRTGASGPDQGVLTVKSLSGFTLTLKSGTVNAILAGKTSLVKDNPSVRVIINRLGFPVYIESAVTLNAANTYSGQTTIRRGTLRITNAGALGTANNDDATGTTIEAGGRRRLPRRARFGFTRHGGGTLELALGAGNHSIANENLILKGRGAFDTKDYEITRRTLERHVRGQFEARGALRNVSGNNTWGGAVRLAGDATIYSTSGSDNSLTLRGAISGMSGLTKTGAGRLTLSGANTYKGATNINAGNLILTGTNDVIPDSSAVTLNSAATGNTARLIVRKDETLGSLSGGSSAGGGIDIEKGRTLTVNQTGETTYNGVIREINPLSGVSMQRAALTKRGAGRLTLGGANLYTGLTTVSAGTLAIAHNQALGTADRGTVVNPGATLELAPASGNLNIANEALTLSGQGVNAGTAGGPDYRGALRNVRGNNTWGGALTLASDSLISGMGALTLSGAIDGAHDLTLAGALIARFSGPLGGTTPLRNLTVNGANSLILNANLTVTERVTLGNISGAEGVTRESGALRTRELLLRDITGRVQLRGDVDTLAANNIGALDFEDTDGLTVGTVAGVSGMTTNNAAVILRADGDLNLAADIRAGRGAIRLTSGAGDIYGSGTVTASGTLTLEARGIGRAATPLNLNFTGMTAGSLSLTTRGRGRAGNIHVQNAGDLKTSTFNLDTDDLTAQTARFASGGVIEVDDADGGASNLDVNDTLILAGAVSLDSNVVANNPAFTFTGPVTATGDRVVNTGRGALAFRSTIDAGANRLRLTSARLTLTDDITAGALDMGASGQLVIAGNSPTLIVDPANITFPNLMTGTGSLTIPGNEGQDLDVGEDLRLPANMRDYRGHLIIGGRLTPEGAMPYYGQNVTDIRVHVSRLTVSRAIETGGPVTLLAGDLDLNADIQTGGQLGLLAIGPNQPDNPGLSGSTGTIRAGAGRVRLTVPSDSVAPNRPAAAFIAVGGFRNAANINLALNRREVDVASGQGAVGFDPGSLTTDQTTDPDFRAFVERLGAVLGTSRPLGLRFAQTFVVNPAAGLTSTETLAFVDLSLFGEELTLFGSIGTGIALALSQCEEQDGCAPNVTLEELDTLIEQLEARIAELERRRAEADESERAAIDLQLVQYRRELRNFRQYRADLKKYILAEEEEEVFSDEALDGPPDARLDRDELAKLNRVLQSVRTRIQWLEGLRTDPAARQRLGQATGQDLTPERLEVIIEAAKAQATFIENRIRLLLEGKEAGLPRQPEFRAEAGDYEAVDVVQYGEPPGALTLSGERGWY